MGIEMGELLDRDFQRHIMSELQGQYPHAVNVEKSWGKQGDNRLLVNLSYLSEYGLVDLTTLRPMSGDIIMNTARVTAKGMDFLADDGGLGAILGIVTVKLHEDTIKALLIQKIEAASGDEGVKASLIAKIKNIPSDALGAVTTHALDKGLDNIPNLLALIGSWLD